MRFVWDPAKARANLAKHGISFELAQKVWDDPLMVVALEGVENAEQRWGAIGLVGPVLTVVVIHAYPDTDPDEVVGIISARRATRYERRRYEQNRI
ncbi:MAG: BrnT family toxin [Caulobacteraceae bacterium]